MELAEHLGLQCVHISTYCGHRFYQACDGGGTHAPTLPVCPECGKTPLSVCNNIVNPKMAGHYDVLGVSWAIELKSKVNKGPERVALKPHQEGMGLVYDSFKVPSTVGNEDSIDEIFKFLTKQKTFKEESLKSYAHLVARR
jgi:hypothetical protein